ncbi:amino-acid N-acetyltransferase [Chromatiales bacterium (ex Bugula neritina AB1)]|nr:amino-acid N-acetyltransferase [Chromatiales bacterium (ex Bugula neritina AB1)]
MSDRQDTDFPIHWLRHTSPYINTHRDSTIVIWFNGELLDSAGFASFVHDLTLLSHLGVRLVLVHGMRPQIDVALAIEGIEARFGPPGSGATSQSGNRVRITDSQVLPALHTALGKIRCQIESAFSSGLPNTPMSGAQVTVAGGNFVVAKPYGIRDGIDYCHTGEVRKFRKSEVNQLLDSGMVVLLSPIGYSPTGELLNLHAEDVALQAAIDLNADKLVFLHKSVSQTPDTEAAMLREISATDSTFSVKSLPESLAPLESVIERSLHACQNGVQRCHIVSSEQDGALLKELFTRDGSGLLIDSGSYDTIREASNRDVAGIMQLIKPLIDDGILISRSEQDLERQLSEFIVAERDGTVIACASLTVYEYQAELGCLAVHPQFRHSGKAAELLQYLIRAARKSRCTELFALTTRSGDWFREQGFIPAELRQLPAVRNSLRDQTRSGSKLYTLDLT